MTRDEIVTALRCCAEPGRDCEEDCPMNEISREPCREVLAPAAADLIENQQNHIAALLKANDSLKDAITRRDKLAKAVAVKEENNGQADISPLSEEAKKALEAMK